MMRQAFCCMCLALLGVTAARGQGPINTDVALQPSPGGLIVRQQFRYFDGSDIEGVSLTTTAVYGIRDDLSLIFKAPLIFRDIDMGAKGTERHEGVADLTLLTKYRIYRDDFGPGDTSRFDLLGGLEIRSGDSDLSSDSYDPVVGGVWTWVKDRNSVSADWLWKFNTGGGAAGADEMKYDLAYLYRLAPQRYGNTQQPTALFGVIEFNGRYETNGDHEIFISPGLVWAATRVVLEIGVQLPAVQELDHRPEKDFVWVAGFRLRF